MRAIIYPGLSTTAKVNWKTYHI